MSDLTAMVLANDEIGWLGAHAVVWLTAVIMVGSGFLVRGIAARAADGRLAKNGLAGIRTKATMSSDEAWRAAHQAGEVLTKRGGSASVVFGLLAMIAGPAMALFDVGDPEGYIIVGMVLIGVATVALLALVIAGAVSGQRAAVEVRDRRPKR